ncbi:bacterio-opsin activator HTH domain-containing protein [Halodesulfurarchaeum formicicum]|uniref:Bacterio-opsin activator HTH domain-containing protein n=2 Tax=Halodesulfurarchaeum formicicum TaxID=1873524 RepID=A0A1D8S593_9EURY|nr:bacterio-opsin activator HTH domain-containing protein [Halodesulfurarchaeum formicicum]
MPQQTPTESTRNHMSERGVKVVFEIVPKGSCFMDQLEGQVSDVELHFPNGECHADVTVSEDDGVDPCRVEVINYSGEVCQNCPGTIFADYGLVPRFLERNDDEFVVQTHLPTNHDLSDVVADLRAVSERVTVVRIVDMRNEDVSGISAEIDLSQLTAKQHEALESAVKGGYYGLSQEVSLEVLAGEIGISTSALSQRLARAERHVLTQLFEEE